MSVRDSAKNRGAHGDSSFTLGRVRPSSENPPALAVGSVNKNLPCVVKAFGGSDCRKVVADEYLDDRALLPGSLGSGQKGNRRLTSAYAARNGTRNREKESEQ